MASKSMQMGDEATSSFLKPFIKSHFLTKIRHAPEGTDLSGKVAIITGGSSGLGFQCARHFLKLKLSHLILAVRSPEKGQSAADELRGDNPLAKIDVWPLEMTSYPSIQAFCKRVEIELPRLDITILNSGLIKTDFGTCSTGHEETIQVNYISTFLLAILMLPLCKAKAPEGKPGRLTIVNSGTAPWAKFPNRDKRPLLASFDNTKIQPWDAGDRYFTSKLLGQLFFARMIEYLDADDVIVNLVEPGLTKGSALHRDATGAIALAFNAFKDIAGRKLEDGAWMYVDATVVQGKESHGSLCMDWKIFPFAPLIYLPEGQPIMDALWEETMAEFEFAGAREILEGYRRSKTTAT